MVIGFQMPKYLLKQRQGWYAVLEIPKGVREHFGKARFKETLQTDSLRVAQLRVLPLVARWKTWIEAVQGGDASFDAEISAWRSERRRLSALGVPDWEVEEALFNVAADSVEPERYMELYQVSAGRWVRLSEHIPEYLASLQGTVAPKTIDMRRSDLIRFAAKFNHAHDVTRKSMIDWVENDLITSQGLSAPTCSRVLSALRGYWAYLQRHKSLDLVGPFDGVVPTRKNAQRKSGRVRTKRSFFTPADFSKLLGECLDDRSLSDLIWLGAYTGCRIEELCSLNVTQVTEDCFRIEDAKTDAGWRIIPIHSSIRQLVARLLFECDDSYLISGLSFNKYGDRSNAIGKRFGRLKTKCGFGPELVFHSFRKGVATQLENAGVPENVTARLLGHEFHTMSYGVYSGGLSYDVLHEAVEKLSWD